MALLIKQVILYKFQQWYGDKTIPPVVPQDKIGLIILEALETQDDLRWDNFAKGRTSKCWGEAQSEHLKLFHPDSKKYTQQQ
eukprot:2351095-Ditylum_brightwellii.AAC.1